MHDGPMAKPDPDLWTFATGAYDAAGAACLALQDRHGVDVTILLFAAWVGETRGVAMGDAQIAQADDWIADWRDGVVQPLRTLRRRLKHTGTEDLRSAILAAELEAERISLATLERNAPGWRGGFAPCTAANLDAVFLHATGHPPDREAAGLLSVVASAAHLEARP